MSMSEVALGQGLAGAAVPGGASDAPGTALAGVSPASVGAGESLAPAGAEPGHALGRMIEQLANQYFASVPGPALDLGRDAAPGLPVAVSGFPAPGPVAPPSGVFPSGVSVGAGGFSPGAGWVPPTPGILQSPPIASGPLPKESDLRTLPAMLSEGLGISSPVGLARGHEPSPESAPYFMELAGLPSSAPASGGLPTFFTAPLVPASPAFGPSPGAFGAPPAIPGGLSPGAAVPNGLPPAAVPPGGVAPSAASPAVASPASAGAAPSAPPAPGGLPGAHGVDGFPGAFAPPAVPSVPHAPSPTSVPSFGTSPPTSGVFGTPSFPSSPAAASSVDAAPAPATPAVSQAPGALQQAGVTSAPPAKSAPAGLSSAYSYSPHEISLVPSSYDQDTRGGLDNERLDRGARRIFDPASIRADFPILKERVNGRELVWFDNAATTQKPRAVIDRISYFYEHENSNIHRAAHTLAARATDAYEGARETTRRFLNAPSVSEIIFARGTTEAINLVAQTWGRRYLQSGDEVVITWLEHHANIVPWQLICSERGARLKVAPVDDDGQVLLYEYEKLLGSRTKFVSLSHVSNALGTIVPVQQMVSMAHRHGATVLVDGAQAVSHTPVDVQAIDCDFYVFSGHKIFGPTGIGALFGKAAVLDAMPPWQGGGNMIRDVTFEKTQFQGAPARFEAGTPNIADAVGLGAALEYVSALGLENISKYEHELLVYATERLQRIPGLRLFGTAPDKAGVLSFTIEGLKTEDIGVALDKEGIAVRASHHCAQPILRRFGVETTVRASLAPYNNCDDVDALVAALHRLRAMRY